MLTERAERDHSTGLANRHVLETTLSHAAATQAWALPGRVVLFIDLDHFKAVNDSFGHAAGDFVLSVVAERIVAAVAEPIHVIGGTASVGASVGLAISSSGLSAAELLALADTAAYSAKRAGRNRVHMAPDRVRQNDWRWPDASGQLET